MLVVATPLSASLVEEADGAGEIRRCGGDHDDPFCENDHFEYFSIQALAISTASSGVSQIHIMFRARSAIQVVPPTWCSSTEMGDRLGIGSAPD